jgi:hypothetical protein
MIRSGPAAVTLAILCIAVRGALLPGDGPAAHQPTSATADSQAAAYAWGEVAEGLQLHVSTGRNTESLTETESILYLTVLMRNVSETPVPVDFTQATYDFEYEIDGTWYAFERIAPVRTPLSVLYAENAAAGLDLRSRIERIDPDASRWTVLTVPLAGRSRALQLFAIAASGPGQRFEPTPGGHVVRIRPGRALEATRRAPVSNAVTVSLRTPIPIDRRPQSVSFSSSRDTALQELRFASGPADGQALIRDVLARPPEPTRAPRLITSAALDVLGPLPVYELPLPRRLNAPNPPLPAMPTGHQYLVRASDQTVGTIGLASSAGGSVLNSIGSATSSELLFLALQRLAGAEQARAGSYEPRLVRVVGVRGSQPFLVLWLRSSLGRPDLFYRPPEVDVRGATTVEVEKVYSSEEFLTAARTLPVAPRFGEAWAITAATACAKAMWVPGSMSGPLIYERASVEIGLSDRADRIVWYVYFPERLPQDIVTSSHSGAGFLVDEADGTCRVVMQG